MEVEKYNRFFLLNAIDSSSCYAVFTDNSEESRKIFRYASHFAPGQQVHLLKPQLIGHLSRGNTLLLQTKEPLVHVANPTEVSVPPRLMTLKTPITAVS